MRKPRRSPSTTQVRRRARIARRKARKKKRKMAKHKLITIPEPKQVVDLDGDPVKEREIVKSGDEGWLSVPTEKNEKPWTMRRWLTQLVLSHKHWGEKHTTRAVASRVDNAFAAADDKEADTVKVRAEDHRAVKDFIESEDFSVPAPHHIQLYCFEEAWLDASDCEITSDKK